MKKVSTCFIVFVIAIALVVSNYSKLSSVVINSVNAQNEGITEMERTKSPQKIMNLLHY